MLGVIFGNYDVLLVKENKFSEITNKTYLHIHFYI